MKLQICHGTKIETMVIEQCTSLRRKGWIHLQHTRGVARGGTPLYGLNRDVRPDRVWFSEDFVLNGVSISSIFVLNRVSLHDLMYSLTAEPSQKAKFLPVCQCSAY